jgi:hypothetical protein
MTEYWWNWVGWLVLYSVLQDNTVNNSWEYKILRISLGTIGIDRTVKWQKISRSAIIEIYQSEHFVTIIITILCFQICYPIFITLFINGILSTA